MGGPTFQSAGVNRSADSRVTIRTP